MYPGNMEKGKGIFQHLRVSRASRWSDRPWGIERFCVAVYLNQGLVERSELWGRGVGV
ncbi:hypothetical protein J6590_106475, partial [Homalodisca vitripennis]